ncbi:hypothetical protein GQ43DRAFT_497778, partial [Delitschia confertaspora ATCC 74209]
MSSPSYRFLHFWVLLFSLLLISSSHAAVTVNSTVLVIARDAAAAFTGYSVLQGYGIPYQVILVTKDGAQLPLLNSSATAGNFGGIVVISDVAYSLSSGWGSALTTSQWQQMYDYQTAFGVRMVRLDAFPSSEFGVISLGGTADDQLVSISNATAFPTAGLIVGAGVGTSGLFHYQAQITDPSKAIEVAQFAADGNISKSTAAVINRIGGREQMVWFLPWATDWSQTSTFLSHAWIHWMTRSLYLGFRRVYFSTQVDDMFLDSPLYYPGGTTFRVRPDDLSAHVSWTKQINAKMPAGSQYFMEIAHNGNGNIKKAASVDSSKNAKCSPRDSINFIEQTDIPLEFVKPLGTGISIWPSTPSKYAWTDSCCALDPLEQFWTNKSNLNAFAHVSNNATYSDVVKEITWNQAWLKQVGIDQATRFSPNGLVPPAITGLHNGDALQAWMENGIKYAVGDNTRPSLINLDNSFHPFTTSGAANGYAGMIVMGRWATTIYYNCDFPDCIVQEWANVRGEDGSFQDIMEEARETNSKHLLGLHWDPFMFHQANLRYTDVPVISINGGAKQRYSLLMAWVETIVKEMTRLTTWPLITLKHDDLAQAWIAREARDACRASLTWTLSDDRKTITGVTLDATNRECLTPLPVTFPGTPKLQSRAAGPVRMERVGSDPLTIWSTLDGGSVNFTIGPGILVTAGA